MTFSIDRPTYQEIAEDWGLWCDYHDLDGREDFESMTVDERLASIVDVWGNAEVDDD